MHIAAMKAGIPVTQFAMVHSLCIVMPFVYPMSYKQNTHLNFHAIKWYYCSALNVDTFVCGLYRGSTSTYCKRKRTFTCRKALAEYR